MKSCSLYLHHGYPPGDQYEPDTHYLCNALHSPYPSHQSYTSSTEPSTMRQKHLLMVGEERGFFKKGNMTFGLQCFPGEKGEFP